MTGTVKGATQVGIDERLTRLRLQLMATEMGRRFGQRMRVRRLELGLKQREVAARMRDADPENADAVQKQHISDWERGVEPSDRYKSLIAQALEVSDVSYFYEEPGKPTESPLDVFASTDANLPAKVEAIAEKVQDLHDLLLGDPPPDAKTVAGIAARLLRAAESPPPRADDPPRIPRAAARRKRA